MSYPKSLLPDAADVTAEPAATEAPAAVIGRGLRPDLKAKIDNRFAEKRAARAAQWAAEDAAAAKESAEFETEFGEELAELRAAGEIE